MENNKDAVIKIVLLIICVVFAFLAWSLFRNLRSMEYEFNEKKAALVKESLDIKDRLESLQEIVNNKTEALTSLEGEKEALNNKLILLREENKKLNKAYAKLRLGHTLLMTEKEDIIGQLEELREKTFSLGEMITGLEKSPLVERIRDALNNEENNKIRKVLEEALRSIELIKAGKYVDLKPIVVVGKENEKSPQPAPQPPPKEEKPAEPSLDSKAGKVLSLDGKNNLAVIDIGRKDKVREGDRCAILKEGKEIAYGEIISVRYNISAVCIDEIQYKHLITDIKEGDTVVIKEE